MLLYFVADIMRQPELQQQFRKDPQSQDELMNRYGLTDSQKEMIRNADRKGIANAIADEVRNWKPHGSNLGW